jgi:Protein tyrosine and serine/threonine kinase
LKLEDLLCSYKEDVCAIQSAAGLGQLKEKPEFALVGSAYWIGVQHGLEKLGEHTEVGELRKTVADLRGCALMFYGEPSKESMNQLGAALGAALALVKSARDRAVPLSWALRLKLASDMARGMAHLHDRQPPIVHRDLKTPNVFVCQPLSEVVGLDPVTLLTDAIPLAKVADFGLSARLCGVDALQVATNADDAIANINPLWAAPEVLSRKEYGKPADVYAFGMMLWELVTREIPFHPTPIDLVKSVVFDGERPEIPEHTPQCYAELIRRCWAQEPRVRPCFDEVIRELGGIAEQLVDEFVPESKARGRRDVRSIKQQLAGRGGRMGACAHPRSHTSPQQVTSIAIRVIDGESLPAPAQSAPLRVHCLAWDDVRFLWVGCEKGVLLVCDEEDSFAVRHQTNELSAHQGIVHALAYLGDTAWSGADDGRLRVWDARLQQPQLQMERLRHSGQCTTKIDKAHGASSKGWCVLRDGRLQVFKQREEGAPAMEVLLSMATKISKEQRAHGIAVLIHYKEGHKKRIFKLLPPAEQLDAWWRKIQQVHSLCQRVQETEKGATVHPLHYMLEMQLGGEGRSPAVLALRVIDGHVWSASSGLAVAEWRLARERGTDQRRIEMGRSIQLDADALGRRPLLNAMCRVSQQQVWLAVGHQLVPLELSFDKVAQKPVVCAIDADLCITDLVQVQVEVDGESTSYVCTVDTGGWLRVWDPIGAREVLAVQMAAEGNALQALLSVGGELWVGGGGAASAVLRRYQLVESGSISASSDAAVPAAAPLAGSGDVHAQSGASNPTAKVCLFELPSLEHEHTRPIAALAYCTQSAGAATLFGEQSVGVVAGSWDRTLSVWQ